MLMLICDSSPEWTTLCKTICFYSMSDENAKFEEKMKKMKSKKKWTNKFKEIMKYRIDAWKNIEWNFSLLIFWLGSFHSVEDSNM